jgi:hypothetical protein
LFMGEDYKLHEGQHGDITIIFSHEQGCNVSMLAFM